MVPDASWMSLGLQHVISLRQHLNWEASQIINKGGKIGWLCFPGGNSTTLAQHHQHDLLRFRFTGFVRTYDKLLRLLID